MSMISFLSQSEAHDIRFVPAASILVSVGYFKDCGVPFTRDADDLDDYDFVAMRIEGLGEIALMHYVHSSDSEVSLLIKDAAGDGLSELMRVMEGVADFFHLPLSAFHWREGGEPASMSDDRIGKAA